ncbi:MAG: cellulose synthase family protein [Myxococcota bacterium]
MPLSWPQTCLLLAYYGAMLCLAALSLHRVLLAWPWRSRRQVGAPPELPGSLPRVTVQLPVFNEADVVERLIDATASLDWPRHLLEIQVLDDSTDETVTLAAACAARWRERGVEVHHIRGDRTGFKAGALQRGLGLARGELIAIFDADFVPPRDFLRRTVGHFNAADVGLVQVRWGHLNEGASLLTRVQALMLDGHFCVEQAGRSARGACFNFNGTAGVWRRAAIETAGGWRADTLTEDLDLSYRAQLAGWRFIYRDDVVAPAELPAEMAAFKGQQHRWTKGSAQTAQRLLPALWRSNLPLRIKLEATAHLVNNVAYVLIALLALLMPVVPTAAREMGLRNLGTLDAALWLLGMGALSVFYVVASRRAGRSPWAALVRLPALVALGAGISVANARGVVGAALSVPSPFVRTPKRGDAHVPRYRARVGLLPLMELGLAAWLMSGVVSLAQQGLYATLPMLAVFSAGLLWVGSASLRQVFTSVRNPASNTVQMTGAVQEDSSQETCAPSVRQTA